jgi:cytochrome c-type biogenesis protein CcmH/NrfG
LGDESPWHLSARELLGVAAFKAGNFSEARTLLTPLLLDQKAPQSIAERAQIVMAEIAADELAKKDASAAPATPAPAEPAPAGATADKASPGKAAEGSKKE